MDPSDYEVLRDTTPCHWEIVVDVLEVFAVPSSEYKQCKKPLCWNYVYSESGFSRLLRNVGNYQPTLRLTPEDLSLHQISHLPLSLRHGRLCTFPWAGSLQAFSFHTAQLESRNIGYCKCGILVASSSIRISGYVCVPCQFLVLP